MLQQLRKEAGLSQADLCRELQISQTQYSALERGAISPIGSGRQWITAAVRLSEYFGMSEDMLFPKYARLELMEPQKLTEVIDSRMHYDGMNSFVDSIGLAEKVRKVLSTLTPREEKVLRMRFGIGEKSDHFLEEIAQDFGVQRERIRQIEAKALRKLRHPSRSKHLKAFADGLASEVRPFFCHRCGYSRRLTDKFCQGDHCWVSQPPKNKYDLERRQEHRFKWYQRCKNHLNARKEWEVLPPWCPPELPTDVVNPEEERARIREEERKEAKKRREEEIERARQLQKGIAKRERKEKMDVRDKHNVLIELSLAEGERNVKFFASREWMNAVNRGHLPLKINDKNVKIADLGPRVWDLETDYE